MQIHTVEQDYDYRIRVIIQQMLKDDPDIDIQELDNGDDFANWLWGNLSELGKAVFEDMMQYQSEDDWLEEVSG
jgi:hypothetical protein